jgi:hypothetical protein
MDVRSLGPGSAAAFLAGATLLLAGCESSEDRAFMADCQSKRGFSREQCSCVKDLINDSVQDEKGRTYVKALVVGDQSKAAQIQATFGLMEGGRILARATWLATNAPQACGVAI